MCKGRASGLASGLKDSPGGLRQGYSAHWGKPIVPRTSNDDTNRPCLTIALPTMGLNTTGLRGGVGALRRFKSCCSSASRVSICQAATDQRNRGPWNRLNGSQLRPMRKSVRVGLGITSAGGFRHAGLHGNSSASGLDRMWLRLRLMLGHRFGDDLADRISMGVCSRWEDKTPRM